jgi:hypothetical protein
MAKQILIGADIEYFLRSSSGEIISAEGIILGTKHRPYNFDASNKYFATSLDNVLAEHCIPPVANVNDWVSHILKSQKYIESLEEGISVAAIPSARLSEKWLQTEQAKLFGCEPDYNAWESGQPNPRPESADSTLRSAGFHVHIGYPDPNFLQTIKYMKAFDIYVTLPSLLIEPENERRQLYGKAGAFRPKDYGMEARTLSSYFASSEQLMRWVFNQTEMAISNVGEIADVVSMFDIKNIINNVDLEQAQDVCNYLDISIAA